MFPRQPLAVLFFNGDICRNTLEQRVAMSILFPRIRFGPRRDHRTFSAINSIIRLINGIIRLMNGIIWLIDGIIRFMVDIMRLINH